MRTHNTFRLSLIAAAVLAAIAQPTMAAEDIEATELTKPKSTVEAGVGFSTHDARRFGQYSGIKDEGPYLLLDLDYRRRDDATGTWYTLRGRNLGLDHRELRFDHNRQGNWGYFIEFGQTPRYEPFTPITGLTGIGEGRQVINGTGLRPVELKTRRDMLSLGADKIVAGGLEFQLRFKNEEKEGARIFGQGDNPGNPLTRFITDPIDYTIRQWEAIANYTTERLQLTAGYYGTSFDNKNTALNLTGTPAPIFTPMALPPGNQSHQVYLSGGYNINPTTRASFKVAYTHQTQDEGFVAPSVTGRTNLDGRVDTKLAQVGLSAQPIPRLSLLANLRYEDKDDKTPLANYFTGVSGTSTLSGTNEPRSFKTLSGKAEASYQLPYGIRALGGFDYEEKERNTFAVRSVSHRDETKEKSYRAELRRTIGETVTGSVGYVHSDRDGSPFLTTVLLNGSLGSNLIAPLHLADRERDKVRASITWMPADPVTLQFAIDEGKDKYDTRTPARLGVREGRVRNYSVDASYAITDTWQATGFYSRNDLRADQATVSGATTWGADISSDSHSIGAGLRGKPLTRLDVGADFHFTEIRDRFRVFGIAGPAPVSNIPEINTRLWTIQLFGRYAVQKNLGVRLNYIYDRWQSDEWTWTGFVYTDGTRLVQEPTQKVHFFGVSVHYTFQ